MAVCHFATVGTFGLETGQLHLHSCTFLINFRHPRTIMGCYVTYTKGHPMHRPELTLVEHFQSIQDYRENHNKQHLLIDIIVVAVCCVICGADNFVEIQTIANEKIDWL